MISVFLHESILKTLKNQIDEDHLHQALFFEGEPSLGKMEAALWVAQAINCKSKLAPCGTCQTCLDVAFYRSKEVLLLSRSDRLPYIDFLQKILLKKEMSSPELVALHLAREISHLLYRHKINLLPRLLKEKVSYKEGIKLSNERLEKLIYQVYLNYQKSFSSSGKYLKNWDDDDWILTPAFLEEMRELQNSLDRTVLTKENLVKIIHWCENRSGVKKLVIIENIELIHSSVIGLFLKLLEEPPPLNYFILITEDFQHLNSEVTLPLLSRCLKFTFSNFEGRINDVLQKKFQIETGYINQEKNLKEFFENFSHRDNFDVINFLQKPFFQISKEIQSKNFNYQKIIDKMHVYLKKYLYSNQSSEQNRIKLTPHQIYALTNYLNKQQIYLNKNLINQKNFIWDLSIYFKNLIKV